MDAKKKNERFLGQGQLERSGVRLRLQLKSMFKAPTFQSGSLSKAVACKFVTDTEVLVGPCGDVP